MPSEISAYEQADALARDILQDARVQLMAALRFMDIALWRMPFARRDLQAPVASDGAAVYYDPLLVVRAYRDEPNQIPRSYLHCILHCVFRHSFDDKHPDAAAWDAACDAAVEACAMELVGLRYPLPGDDERSRLLSRLTEACGALTAQRAYRLFAPRDAADDAAPGARRGDGAGAGLFEQAAQLLAMDDHSVWTREAPRPQRDMRVSDGVKLIAPDDGQHLKGDSDAQGAEDQTPDTGMNSPGAPAPSKGGAAAEGAVDSPDRLVDTQSDEEVEPSFESMDGVEVGDFDSIDWLDISKQMQMDMEAFTGKIGSAAGTFLVNLTVANRKVYDYRDFLKRFSARSEEIKVSTEEFDYIFYTYGLRLYRNMPLVEPLEYQESNRVRDFVIAIDTSASCGGGLVKKFIEKTYDVLKSESGFGRKINVYVIQCDCDIRKVVKITSLADIDDEFSEFSIRGFGGTDFRPVFRYVDELVARRDLLNLKGLIYLTDGLGRYPESPPDYDAAFVFVDDGQRERRVPPWAMKVVMDEDDIVEL